MDFITALFVGVASFFGFGGAPAEQTIVDVQPTIVEEITLEAEESQLEEAVTEVTEAAEETDDVETEAEEVASAVEEPEVVAEDEELGAMTGGAVSLDQITAAAEPEQPAADLPADIRTMIVAGGCFWCVEADLEKTTGVTGVISGYAGGTTESPTYKTYGDGGHREVVEVTYDANQVSFEDILIVTMKTTDPTDDDGTFGDRGDKYSSAFYYETAAQKEIIDNLIAEVDEFGPYDAPLAIDVEPRPVFWAAEDSHQDYYKGLLTRVKYSAYRIASGRTAFIERYWGVNDHSPALPWRTETQTTNTNTKTYMWSNYVKPSKEVLKTQLDDLAYRVTQEDGTERRHTSALDKNWDPGIYVDILSGEPLYSSSDKFDSGTGWPSFVKPITPDALTLHEDRKLFSVRTETRSAVADNHIGHVFNDGPADRGGLRYCMNGAALRFVPLAQMQAEGYGDFIQYVQQ